MWSVGPTYHRGAFAAFRTKNEKMLFGIDRTNIIRVPPKEKLTLEKIFNGVCFPRLAIDSSLCPTKTQHFPSDVRSSSANCVPKSQRIQIEFKTG